MVQFGDQQMKGSRGVDYLYVKEGGYVEVLIFLFQDEWYSISFTIFK